MMATRFFVCLFVCFAEIIMGKGGMKGRKEEDTYSSSRFTPEVSTLTGTGMGCAGAKNPEQISHLDVRSLLEPSPFPLRVCISRKSRSQESWSPGGMPVIKHRYSAIGAGILTTSPNIHPRSLC